MAHFMNLLEKRNRYIDLIEVSIQWLNKITHTHLNETIPTTLTLILYI